MCVRHNFEIKLSMHIICKDLQSNSQDIVIIIWWRHSAVRDLLVHITRTLIHQISIRIWFFTKKQTTVIFETPLQTHYLNYRNSRTKFCQIVISQRIDIFVYVLLRTESRYFQLKPLHTILFFLNLTNIAKKPCQTKNYRGYSVRFEVKFENMYVRVLWLS